MHTASSLPTLLEAVVLAVHLKDLNLSGDAVAPASVWVRRRWQSLEPSWRSRLGVTGSRPTRKFVVQYRLAHQGRFELRLDRQLAVCVGRSCPKRFSIGCALRLSRRASPGGVGRGDVIAHVARRFSGEERWFEWAGYGRRLCCVNRAWEQEGCGNGEGLRA